ncbi:heterokaryon incompatibility protein-domain-containing protein [Thelonectria olida]|uniref:Heterokaryon incompatibility protein-domain-containing protein n=1 Tax=Thelonectria olida TaxID=1576542 RepID=A0A9P8WFB7_9HYPO|nr:heterokaryon incompatibility protein-domain-containing protein [Thelonectria olida]
MCTDFCRRICAVAGEDSRFPTADDLLSVLNLETESYVIGTIEELRLRPDCSFCQLVLQACLENDFESPEGPEGSVEKTSEPIQIIAFPGEHCIRLSYPSRLGTRLMLVQEEGSVINPVQGPCVARIIHNQQVSPSLVRSWLRQCEDHHGDSCSHLPRGIGQKELRSAQISEDRTSNFRLIDLEQGCLRKMPLNTRYVTLSYVWGQTSTFRLLKSNFEKLHEPGSLDELISDMPRTITDAISFTRSVGERYLWVDTLCLIQDDPWDVNAGTEIMNSIYQGSYFAIIAGSGADADAGLPGVSGPRNISQCLGQLNSKLKMAITHSIDWHLRRSVYNQRGWTLQELVLPPRAIIFIDNKLHFRCMKANWCEETFADLLTHWLDPDDSNISRVPESIDDNLAAWWAYQKLCEDYSIRDLRFDGDSIRAITGILRPLSAGLVSWLAEGLPVYYLDISLLFMSANGHLRRRPEFPSYSWAGWSGPIAWPREVYRWPDQPGQSPGNLFRWMEEKTFIQWKVWRRSGSIEDVDCVDRYGMTRRIEKLADEYSHMLPDSIVEELKTKDMPKCLPLSLYASHSSAFPQPSFTRKPRERTKAVADLYDLDLVNSQAEFDKLVSKITDTGEWLTIYNWLAARECNANRRSESNGQGPVSCARDRDDFDVQFRRSGACISHDESSEDNCRAKVSKFAREYLIGKDEGPLPEIPNLPQYHLIYFHTLSIRLILGTRSPGPLSAREFESRKGNPSHHFQRTPGSPLLSPSGELVGSVHLDTEDSLTSGSELECLIMSRCFEPMVNSALPIRERHHTEGSSWNMFWILHIIDVDGISERRGIGQVLDTALLKSCAPGPQSRAVLLG